MEQHLFEGSLLDPLSTCEVCGEKSHSENHIKNGMSVCDILEGPCSCGAWHKT